MRIDNGIVVQYAGDIEIDKSCSIPLTISVAIFKFEIVWPCLGNGPLSPGAAIPSRFPSTRTLIYSRWQWQIFGFGIAAPNRSMYDADNWNYE